jgi:hypothetical protein
LNSTIATKDTISFSNGKDSLGILFIMHLNQPPSSQPLIDLWLSAPFRVAHVNVCLNLPFYNIRCVY